MDDADHAADQTDVGWWRRGASGRLSVGLRLRLLLRGKRDALCGDLGVRFVCTPAKSTAYDHSGATRFADEHVIACLSDTFLFEVPLSLSPIRQPLLHSDAQLSAVFDKYSL